MLFHVILCLHHGSPYQLLPSTPKRPLREKTGRLGRQTSGGQAVWRILPLAGHGVHLGLCDLKYFKIKQQKNSAPSISLQIAVVAQESPSESPGLARRGLVQGVLSPTPIPSPWACPSPFSSVLVTGSHVGLGQLLGYYKHQPFVFHMFDFVNS